MISHLAYADDYIIFTKVNEKGLYNLMEFLHLYEQTTGQLVNNSKIFVVASHKFTGQNLQRIKYIAGFQLKQLLIIYLGGPLFKGRQNESCLKVYSKK